jgi:hypothetical protein
MTAGVVDAQALDLAGGVVLQRQRAGRVDAQQRLARLGAMLVADMNDDGRRPAGNLQCHAMERDPGGQLLDVLDRVRSTAIRHGRR